MTEEDLPVRLSHLLRDCSVGAIVRGPHSLMVVQDIRTWDRPGSDPLNREIRYVDRVKSALKIKHTLCEPPRSTKRDGVEVGWIPAMRFPTWMRCIRCGLLHEAPWRRTGTRDQPVLMSGKASVQAAVTCGVCGGTLEQTPWVLVHENGYLADVPWHRLAHRDSDNPEQRQCASDPSHPYLKLKKETDAGHRVSCERCGSSSVMPTRIDFPAFIGQQPWVREPPLEPPPPNPPALLVAINDVRVHSPSTRTALVIPPESRIRRGTITDHLYASKKDLQDVQNAQNRLQKGRVVKRLANKFRCTHENIHQAIKEIDDGYPLYGEDKESTEADLLADEYRALTEEIPDLREDEDFVTEHHTHEWKAHGANLEAGVARQVVNAVSTLIAVKRLKEVMVFNGFCRAGGARLTPPDIIGESHWVPALELYGEGIFFTLNETMLRRWEDGEVVRNRAEVFKKRYLKRVGRVLSESLIDVSPRFLLCHTLAHLMIRELDANAGYPAASLKERIYSSVPGKDTMAGILIYVAVPDEEGSLGGLMELAKPHQFLRLLTRAFESAAWCSLDPVCSEQEGHGPDLLNRAACHACALVPETSCAYGNILLDRTFVKGAEPDLPAFLDFAKSFV